MKTPLRRFITLLVVAACIMPVTVIAGVTIHYEGRAKDAQAVQAILRTVREEAAQRGWQVREASDKNASLKRVVNEKDVLYTGPIAGVVVLPAATSEPMYIQLDSNGFMQDFVKTQFAGSAVHISVIAFLRKLQPHFESLTVEDEGEYWETRDATKLQAHIDKVNSMIDEMKRTKPGLKGPVTLPSGRIVDLMSSK
jgi:hypothetical protein